MRMLSLAALMIAAPLAAASASPIEVVSGKPPAQSPEVKIEPTRFEQPSITVKAGEVVRWTNTDGATHNVHFRRGPAKGQPNAQGRTLGQGETYAVKFLEKGAYDYIDTLNPTMKGKVVVE